MTDRPSDVVLAHFGVKGMKWGKRKAQAGGSTASTKKPKPSSVDIRNARARNANRQFEAMRLEDMRDSTKSKAGKAKIDAQLKTLGDKFDKDAEVAKRATAGEKVTLALFAGSAALLVASRVAK